MNICNRRDSAITLGICATRIISYLACHIGSALQSSLLCSLVLFPDVEKRPHKRQKAKCDAHSSVNCSGTCDCVFCVWMGYWLTTNEDYINVEKNAKKSTAGEPDRPHRPRKRASEKQQKKVQEKTYENVKGRPKKTVEPRLDQPHRPGTRAWTKQYGEDKHPSPSPNNRKPPPAKLQPQPRQSGRSHQHSGSKATQQVLKSARTGKETRDRVNSKASVKEPSQTQQQPFNRPQTRSVVNQNLVPRTNSGNPPVSS